jgi:hypothetical protein
MKVTIKEARVEGALMHLGLQLDDGPTILSTPKLVWVGQVARKEIIHQVYQLVYLLKRAGAYIENQEIIDVLENQT